MKGVSLLFSLEYFYVGKGTDTERNAMQPCNESVDKCHDMIDLLMVRQASTILASVRFLGIP